MTYLEEVRLRIACCKAEVRNGYGDPHSLRNYVHCLVAPRLWNLAAVKDAIEALDTPWDGADWVALLAEHRELALAKRLSDEYLVGSS